MREVFVKTPKEFWLRSDQIVKRLKPIYGLTDSGYYWNETPTRNLKEELKVIPRKDELALFRRTVKTTSRRGRRVFKWYHWKGIRTLWEGIKNDCCKVIFKFEGVWIFEVRRHTYRKRKWFSYAPEAIGRKAKWIGTMLFVWRRSIF